MPIMRVANSINLKLAPDSSTSPMAKIALNWPWREGATLPTSPSADRMHSAGGNAVSDQDKAAMRRIPLEVFNEGRVEVVDQVVAEGLCRAPAPAARLAYRSRGPEGLC
jgi:hypothetical protein